MAGGCGRGRLGKLARAGPRPTCRSTRPCLRSQWRRSPRCWRSSPVPRPRRSRWPRPVRRLEQDVERVAAVADALGGSAGRIRVDANGGWSVDEARDALPRLVSAAGRGPVRVRRAALSQSGRARRAAVSLARDGHDIRVAADESVRKAEDPLRVAVAGAADVVVIKVAPLGGVGPALEVARELGATARAAGRRLLGPGLGGRASAPGWRWPRPCRTCRSRAAWRRPDCSPLVLAVPRCARATERSPYAGRSRRTVGWPTSPLRPERESWWRDRLGRCHAVLAAGGAA